MTHPACGKPTGGCCSASAAPRGRDRGGPGAATCSKTGTATSCLPAMAPPGCGRRGVSDGTAFVPCCCRSKRQRWVGPRLADDPVATAGRAGDSRRSGGSQRRWLRPGATEQPVYTRYWLHGKGPAPAGNVPVAVHFEPNRVTLGGTGPDGPALALTVACGPAGAAGQVELIVPDGLRAGVTGGPGVYPAGLAYPAGRAHRAGQALRYKLAPNGFCGPGTSKASAPGLGGRWPVLRHRPDQRAGRPRAAAGGHRARLPSANWRRPRR